MKSVRLAALFCVTCSVLVPLAAGGQTAAPRRPQAAPAPAPHPTSAPAPAAPPAPSAPRSAPAKVRIPANIFKLGDAEIIFVGGKQMTAGEVRRDIKAQIVHQAAAPTLVKVASRKVPGQTHMPLTADAAAMLARNHQGDRAPATVDCTQQAPTILAIEGSVASGQQFTILGRCFGEKNGDVKLIGQFPGGSLHVSTDPVHPGVTFTHWDAGANPRSA